jgi:RNA polymerase sigma-70 factor (ECF subfamily)
MICRTRALDHLRRREPAQPHAAPDSLRPDLYRDDNDPLDLLAALERDKRMHAAVASLHDDARRLLALAFFQGLSHREIADRTGLPLGTVKTTLRRAMQELKQMLEHASVSLEETS